MLSDRIIAGFLAFALAFFPALAFAQSPISAFPPGTFQNRAALDAAGSSTPFAIAFGAVNTNTSPVGNVFTFTSVAIGTAAATRIVAVGINIVGNAASNTVASVTINGTSATQATGAYFTAGTGAQALVTDWWYAPCGVVCGTTTTIVVTTGAASGRVSIVTYSVTGTADAFSVAGGSAGSSVTSTSATLLVPSGGGTIGFSVFAGAATSASFTNLTSDLNSASCCGGRLVASGNNTSLSGSNTFTITGNSTVNFGSGSYIAFSP